MNCEARRRRSQRGCSGVPDSARERGTHVVEAAVRRLAADVVLVLVRRELLGLERADEVARVDDERLAADLAEAERREEAGLDAVGLDRLGRVEEVLEGAQLLADVVGVAVARDEAAEDALRDAVEHPGGGTTLGAARREGRSEGKEVRDESSAREIHEEGERRRTVR